MRKQRVWLGVLLVVAFLLVDRAAGGMDDVEESGFLVDYSQLTLGGEDRAALTYVNPDVDFKNYDALMFDRVSVWLSPEAENRDVDPAVFKKMSDYFLNALVKAVEDGYTVVDQPGPNVIRVRAAITDVEPSDPVAKAISVDNIGTGGAEAEMELLDSMSSERLAAAVDSRRGGKPASRGAWEDTKDAFDYWAGRFRERLDRARR
ncbi:MAG: DUF3313 domain-containing protein [Desulfuromonadales bacterium]